MAGRRWIHPTNDGRGYLARRRRIVAGTNFCDIGFELDEDNPQHLVVIAALDNLGKGAAGSAVQCMNLMLGFDETTGLTFPGVYP